MIKLATAIIGLEGMSAYDKNKRIRGLNRRTYRRPKFVSTVNILQVHPDFAFSMAERFTKRADEFQILTRVRNENFSQANTYRQLVGIHGAPRSACCTAEECSSCSYCPG
jgi:hypothetical protein